MKKYFILLFSIFFVITACSSNELKDTDNTDESPTPLEVAIQTSDNINLNEEVVIEAQVTQGAEKVDDAKEVKFEIWKSGHDDHEMLDGKHQGNGIYTVNKTFLENGNYFIVAHITARDMHTMPKKEIIVGTLDNHSEGEPKIDTSSEEHIHDHAHSIVSIKLEKNEVITTNNEAALTAIIKNAGQPLTDAQVRFEIWEENDEKHDYINATDKSKGKYKIIYTFPSKGAYKVKVHVDKGTEIHEHLQKTINVK